MELLIYLILFLLVLIVSSTTNKLLPFLPLPLVQILLGIVIGLFLPNTDFHLNTELFLALVIGPLLFREAEEADVTAILKHWRIIVYLIFPVIFISTLSLGGLAHLLWFSLPLAACLAVGAALGPTDLVAFASLSERFSFPKRVSNILKGEGLLNDASGLVAFQVALTAWTTGAFSLGQASSSLIFSILGGFLTGVTLVSFLTGLLVLPHLSDEEEESKDYLMHIAILNEVTLELEKELEDTRNKLPLYAAIDNYHGRIENLILSQENQDDQEDWAALKLLILSIESDGLEQAYEEGNISNRAYRVYQRYLKNIEQGINRKLSSRLTYYFLVSLRILRFLLHEVFTLGKTFRSWKNKEQSRLRALDYDQIAELYLANTEMIIESLENLKGVYRRSLISFMQESRLRETAIISSGAFVERVINRVKPNNIDEMLRGYYLERKLIFEYEEKRLITTKYAKKLRQNVNNLENYSLKEAANTLPYDMVELVRRN